MKNELIKLAKALKLSGYNSYSSRILKIAEEFDEVTMETNYDKVYAQINSFIQDLKGVGELNTFAKAPLTTIGLQHIIGSLDESNVTVETNIEKIVDYDDVPENIIIDYKVKLKPMLITSKIYMGSKKALTSEGAKGKIIESFNEGIEESYDKHRMSTRMPKEVEFYDRRNLEEIERDNAKPRNEKIKEMFKEEDPLSDGTSDTPLRQNKVYLDSSEKKTIEARFEYTTSVKITQKLQAQYGSNPRGEDDTLSFITIHYSVSIPDPKKDTARRNDLNKKHQEKMKEDERKAEMAEVFSAAEEKHREFVRHLADLKSECVNYINPEPDPGSASPLMATESYKSKCCSVIGNQIAKFMMHYGIRNLDNPSSDEIHGSMDKNKKHNERASEPPVALLYNNPYPIAPAGKSFEECVEAIGKSKPMNIPYHLGPND